MFGSQHPCGDLQPFVPPGSHAFLTFTDIRQKGGAQTRIQANTQTHTIKINKPFKEKCKQKLPERQSNNKSYMFFRIWKLTSECFAARIMLVSLYISIINLYSIILKDINKNILLLEVKINRLENDLLVVKIVHRQNERL